jgi:hypothetical protein
MDIARCISIMNSSKKSNGTNKHDALLFDRIYECLRSTEKIKCMMYRESVVRKENSPLVTVPAVQDPEFPHSDR